MRRLRPDEWADFRRTRLAALAADPGAFVRTADEELARPVSHWSEMLESDDGAVFGLFDGSTLVGMTAVYIDRSIPARDTAALAMTWLHPDYRGNRLSHEIFERRIAWARGKPVARIAVSHREGNEPSRRAIVAHGFRPIGRVLQRWPDGVEVARIDYELPIEPSR